MSYHESIPHLERILVQSFTTATGTGTATGTSGLSQYHHAIVLADVTLASGTAATLSLFVDSKLDGTTFVNIAQFSAITATGQYAAVLSKEQKVQALVGDLLADAGAGTIRNIGWGDDIRTRYSISGTTPSFSARLWFLGIG